MITNNCPKYKRKLSSLYALDVEATASFEDVEAVGVMRSH